MNCELFTFFCKCKCEPYHLKKCESVGLFEVKTSQMYSHNPPQRASEKKLS